MAPGATADAAASAGPMEVAQQWWNETVTFFDALEIVNATPLRNDTAKEAVDFVAQLDLWNSSLREMKEDASRTGRVRPGANERVSALFSPLPGLALAYYRMRVTRTLSKPVIRKGLASGIVYGNVALIAFFLRVVAPRILAAGSSDELFKALGSVGVPDRTSLDAALDAVRAYDGTTKVLLYTLAFSLEKLTMVSDVLPIQIILKTVAPLLFGGLVQGALASAACETLGACCNFAVGRTFLTTRLREFAPFGGEPLGKASWFGAMERAAKEDGGRLVLLLRLAPVIPLPFDSYWYLLGALSVSLSEFAGGHFLGCLKTSFLDACFGELLLTTVAPDAVQSQAQQIVLVETIAFTAVALLVSAVATRLASDLFDESEDAIAIDESSSEAEAAAATGGVPSDARRAD